MGFFFGYIIKHVGIIMSFAKQSELFPEGMIEGKQFSVHFAIVLVLETGRIRHVLLSPVLEVI